MQLSVRNNRIGPILGRHPWVFSGALVGVPEGAKSGELVILRDENGRFLAQGYFNSYSQIAVRLWSWDENEKIDDEFFVSRVKRAFEIRKKYLADNNTDSYRLIHSENDLLPGLIVDKYADYLVVQCHTPGIEFWKEKIVGALVKILKPKGIYERSDVRDRNRSTVIPAQEPESSHITVIPSPQGEESLDAGNSNEKILFGKIPEKIKITENGLKFWVDVIGGQKTGFFLDQRDKRLALQKYCDGKSVLNCFSYTGGFSVYALAGGASKVVSVDSSQSALDLAKENILLNKFDLKKCEFVCSDVKPYLQSSPACGVIILDPPAFIKDRRKIAEGVIGYRKINEAALRLLPPGGILVSCSCSAHLRMPDFRFMISESAGRAGRILRILETYTHGIDHPELAAFVEGEYLKCVFAQVE